MTEYEEGSSHSEIHEDPAEAQRAALVGCEHLCECERTIARASPRAGGKGIFCAGIHIAYFRRPPAPHLSSSLPVAVADGNEQCLSEM